MAAHDLGKVSSSLVCTMFWWVYLFFFGWGSGLVVLWQSCKATVPVHLAWILGLAAVMHIDFAGLS